MLMMRILFCSWCYVSHPLDAQEKRRAIILNTLLTVSISFIRFQVRFLPRIICGLEEFRPTQLVSQRMLPEGAQGPRTRQAWQRTLLDDRSEIRVHVPRRDVSTETTAGLQEEDDLSVSSKLLPDQRGRCFVRYRRRYGYASQFISLCSPIRLRTSTYSGSSVFL